MPPKKAAYYFAMNDGRAASSLAAHPNPGSVGKPTSPTSSYKTLHDKVVQIDHERYLHILLLCVTYHAIWTLHGILKWEHRVLPICVDFDKVRGQLYGLINGKHSTSDNTVNTFLYQTSRKENPLIPLRDLICYPGNKHLKLFEDLVKNYEVSGVLPEYYHKTRQPRIQSWPHWFSENDGNKHKHTVILEKFQKEISYDDVFDEAIQFQHMINRTLVNISATLTEPSINTICKSIKATWATDAEILGKRKGKKMVSTNVSLKLTFI